MGYDGFLRFADFRVSGMLMRSLQKMSGVMQRIQILQ